MQLLTIFASALAATHAMAAPTERVSRDGSVKVAGDNPFSYCRPPSSDILQISDADLSPNPPQAGHPLKVTATGKVTEEITEGAKIHLSAKKGWLMHVEKTFDFCESIQQVGMSCPVPAGKDVTIEKEIDIPSHVPKGTWELQASAETADGKKIACMQGEVKM